jgi:hypothetical protein
MAVRAPARAHAETGKRLDYHEFSQTLEQRVRASTRTAGRGHVKIHVIGFAKLRATYRRPGQGRELLPVRP